MARLALPALAALTALLPGDAQAAPAIHELRAAPSAAASSSVRVLDASVDGTRTNGKIIASDPDAGTSPARARR